MLADADVCGRMQAEEIWLKEWIRKVGRDFKYIAKHQIARSGAYADV